MRDEDEDEDEVVQSLRFGVFTFSPRRAEARCRGAWLRVEAAGWKLVSCHTLHLFVKLSCLEGKCVQVALSRRANTQGQQESIGNICWSTDSSVRGLVSVAQRGGEEMVVGDRNGKCWRTVLCIKRCPHGTYRASRSSWTTGRLG